MTVAIYARVSSDSQEARGTIGSQLDALRQKMAGLGHQVVHEYTDDGYSGTRLDRPGLDALRDAAEAGLFEQVWCLTPDRLARSYAYQILITDELARHGVQIHYVATPCGASAGACMRMAPPVRAESRYGRSCASVGCWPIRPIRAAPATTATKRFRRRPAARAPVSSFDLAKNGSRSPCQPSSVRI